MFNISGYKSTLVFVLSDQYKPMSLQGNISMLNKFDLSLINLFHCGYKVKKKLKLNEKCRNICDDITEYILF